MPKYLEKRKRHLKAELKKVEKKLRGDKREKKTTRRKRTPRRRKDGRFAKR